MASALTPHDVPDTALMSDEAFERWLNARFAARIADVYAGIARTEQRVTEVLQNAGMDAS